MTGRPARSRPELLGYLRPGSTWLAPTRGRSFLSEAEGFRRRMVAGAVPRPIPCRCIGARPGHLVGSRSAGGRDGPSAAGWPARRGAKGARPQVVGSSLDARPSPCSVSTSTSPDSCRLAGSRLAGVDDSPGPSSEPVDRPTGDPGDVVGAAVGECPLRVLVFGLRLPVLDEVQQHCRHARCDALSGLP